MITKKRQLSRSVVAVCGAVLFSNIFTDAKAQSLQPGERLLAFSYTNLQREDAGTERNADTAIISYTYQRTTQMAFTGYIGQSRTEGIFPPAPADRQETDNPLVGVGMTYSLGSGREIGASLIYGDIGEEYTSGGTTTRGDGDTLTASLRFSQTIPLSEQGFLTGAVSGAVSKSEYDTPGISNSSTSVRYDGSLTVGYVATPDLVLKAGIHRASANNVITITGDRGLTRGKIGATYRFNQDTAIALNWMEGIGAEDTHQRLQINLMRRF
jgi:hypothetical protein